MSIRKRRLWIWIVCALLLVAGIPLCLTFYRSRQEEAEFLEQLRLARAEGIPTTAAEYAAKIPPAKPEENAAPLYRQVKATLVDSKDIEDVLRQVNFHPSQVNLVKARDLLAKNAKALDLADKATALPRCWFDRHWEGEATLFPELADMKNAARLLVLRGSLKADRDDVVGSIKDIQRVFVIAKHAGEEPEAISHLVRESIYGLGLRALASWSLVHRKPAFAEVLKQRAEDFPRPNLKEEYLGNLYSVLSMIDLCATSEGRQKLGLREEDMPKASAIFQILLSQSKSRIAIVKAERDTWAALDLPRAERASKLETSNHDLASALLAFPVAARMYDLLGGVGGDWNGSRLQDFEARRLQYLACARALRSPAIPKTLSLSDLKSPFDEKPVRYSFDGKQMEIMVSGFIDFEEKPRLFKLPRDSDLKR